MALHSGCGLRVGNILHVVGILLKDEKGFLGGSMNLGCGSCGSSMDGASGHRCTARTGPRQTSYQK